MATILKYNKKGYDIIGSFEGKGFDMKAQIWTLDPKTNDYNYVGLIYKGLTASCGTARQAKTWTTKNDGTGESYKLTWVEAAKKLKRQTAKNLGAE